MPTLSHMPAPPLDWLRLASDGKLEITGINVAKALRYQAYIQLVNRGGEVLHSVAKLADVAQFRVTKRGDELLEGKGQTTLPFNKADLPLNIRLWVSAFRRWTRNCPEELCLAYADGEMHVLAKDNEGKVKNDEAHRLSSMKVAWHE